MRAVNLIPEESKGGGRSGVAPYVLLGVLAVLLAGVAYYVLTSNAIVDRKAKLAALENQTQAAQAQAQAVQPYKEFALLAQARVQTIRQLGQARFDWQRALSDLSKVMPSNVWLTSLTGTVTTGVSIQGGGGGGGDTSSLRGALPNPAIELSGCTTDHDSVVRLISRLRLMHTVTRVSLADSTKGDSNSGGGGGGGGAGSGDCRHGHGNFPQFDLVVFFNPIPAVPAPSTPGATPASGTSTAAPAGGAQPAASTTPSTPPQSTTPAPAPASTATTPSSSSSGSTGANRGAG